MHHIAKYWWVYLIWLACSVLCVPSASMAESAGFKGEWIGTEFVVRLPVRNARQKNKKIACTKSQSMIYSFSQKDRIVANNICKLSLLFREGESQRPKREVIS